MIVLSPSQSSPQSCRGSTDAIKHAQHYISILIQDPSRDLSHFLPKSTPSSSQSSAHARHLIAHNPPSLSTLDSFDEPVDAPPAKGTTAAASVCITVTTTSGVCVAAKATYKKAGSGGSVSTSVTVTGSKSTSSGSHQQTVAGSGRGVKAVGTPSSKHQHNPSGLTLTDPKHVHPGTTTSATARSVASSVLSSTHAVAKSSTSLTTLGPVRRLFTLTSQGTTQATVVVSATQTLSYPPKSSTTLAHCSSVKSVVSTSSATASSVISRPPLPPLSSGKPPTNTVNGVTPVTRGGEGSKPPGVKSVCPTSSQYSSVIGSQETQPMSVIEQPLQQIMKTPTIFQEPATQLTKPKKKSTYSDAVGKRLSTSEMGSFSAANKVGVVGNQPVGMSLPPPPSQPKLNLAPGSRPTVNDSGAMVRMVVCIFYQPASQPATHG